jgi:hypothetical protein
MKVLDRIQTSSAREARKNVTTGIVKSIDFDRMNVVPKGSTGMLRHVRIIGDPNTVAVGDEVSLMFTENETVAMVNAVTTDPPIVDIDHAETHAVIGTDPITPQMIGAAPMMHTHDASDIGNLLDAVSQANGDVMTKTVYDTDGDGLVDVAASVTSHDGRMVLTETEMGDVSATLMATSPTGFYPAVVLEAVKPLVSGGSRTGSLVVTETGFSFTPTNNPNPAEAFIEGNKLWHEGNDGHTSGLDADTLDGLQAAEIADKSFIHTQNLASTTWSVSHKLNKFPSVSVVDSGNNAVVGAVVYVDANNLTISFAFAFSGKAYIN